MNWQHINNNVYYEKGQERSIRMIHRKKSNRKKTEEMKKNQRLRAAAAFESLENTSGNVEIAFGMEFAYYNFCFDHHFL